MEIIINSKRIDCRQINSTNFKVYEIQKELTRFAEKWLDRDKVNNELMYNEWNTNVLYGEGHQFPLGKWIGDVSAYWEAKNNPSPNTIESESGKLYLVNNIVRPMREKLVGEYTSVEKSIDCSKSDLHPQYQGIVTMSRRILEHIEKNIYGTDDDDTNEIWLDYMVPAIEGAIDFGQYHLQPRYNYLRNRPYGAIEMDAIHPRLVYIDTFATTQKYYKDANHQSRKRKVTLTYMRNLLKEAGFDENKVTADNDWEEGELKKSSSYNEGEFCTLYEIEFRVMYGKKFSLAKHYGVELPPGKEDYSEVPAEEFYWYKMLYYKPVGVFDYQINEIGQFSIKHLIYKPSNVRFHALAPMTFWKTMQDLHNSYLSIDYDNYRMHNGMRLIIAKELIGEFGAERVYNWIRASGALEMDMTKIKNADDLKKLVMNFDFGKLPGEALNRAEIASNYLKQQGFYTGPAEGEFPKMEISDRAINTLLSERRQTLSFFDINIKYAYTDIMKYILRILGTHYREEKFIEAYDISKKSNSYIPYNARLTKPELDDLLKRNNTTIEEFQKENIVIYVAVKSGDQEAVDNSMIIYINFLYNTTGLTVKTSLTFDSENKAEYKKQIKFMMWQKGKYPDDMFMRSVGLEDEVNEVMNKIASRNAAEQIMQGLVKRPELFEIVGELFQKYDLAKAQAGGEGTQKQLNPEAQAA